jgi:hypothetical protein
MSCTQTATVVLVSTKRASYTHLNFKKTQRQEKHSEIAQLAVRFMALLAGTAVAVNACRAPKQKMPGSIAT